MLLNQWRTTPQTRLEFSNLPQGDYTFAIKAVDQDLNYSEPARVTLNVIPLFLEKRLRGMVTNNE